MTTGQASFLDWLKNNIITISIVVGGFVVTVWQLKADVASLQMQLSEQKSQLETQLSDQRNQLLQIQGNQGDERITSAKVSDTLDMHGRDIGAINKHLESVDSMVSNLRDTQATLTANLQLVNQELGFLSTSKTPFNGKH